MSYNNPNQGGYAPPYQGHSPVPPQQGWAQAPPPASPYQPQDRSYPPPMQNHQYPPAQGYQQPPPGQYGAPPAGYPPQQYGAPANQWQQPPPNQWQQPPPVHAPYGAAPPNQYPQAHPAPPQQYGQAPPNQWQQSPPPGQPAYGAPPGQPAYGAPPPGQHPAQGFPVHQPYPAQYGAADPPSPGYGPLQTNIVNMHNETEAIFKALKGFGTNEKDLIRILHHLDPIQAANLQEQYKTRFTQDLAQRLEKEVSGYFRDGIVSIVQGPLISDCINLRNATKGLGTQEAILDDILVGRSNADINAIKAKYQELFRTSLEADLRGDLSAGTEEMFVMIIHARRAESSAPVNPQEIEQHVGDLQSAMGNFVSKNTTRACELILYKNDQQTNALADAWRRRFHKSLAEDIEAKFSGHMEGTLLLHLQRAQNRALSDAIKLEDSMAGIGTKDKLLVQRVIRAHWDRRHMAQVRHEYQTKYKKDLVKRVKGETSGDYCKLMVACIE